MKTIILSSLLILTTLIVEAQNDVFPMGDINPEWRVSVSEYDGTGIQMYIDTWLGGVVVDSCGESWTNISIETADGSIGETNYYYSTQGQQVYLRTGLDCSQRKRLIYDFSLELGDSVSIYSPYMISNAEDSITYHVLGVSYYCYGGILRKYMFVQYEMGDPFDNSEPYTVYRTAWIEGIGDTTHPFPAIGGVCVYEGFCEIHYRLNCLNTTEGTAFSRESTTACEYDLSFLTRIHVDVDNTSTYQQDGSKWSQAFSSLQDAIAIADYGDSIWVAEGTYLPTNMENRSAYFELQNGVKIFGGFNATEQYLEERDWALYPTILSGEIGDTNTVDDNSFHVIYTIGSDSTTWLDGFTIRDGNAFGSGIDRQGGGVLADTNTDNPITEPIFKNCLFTKNQSHFYGGAVSCFGPDGRFSVPSFDHCRFIENTSFFGSAVYKTGNAPIDRPQRFTHCLFEDNFGTDGAAVFLEFVCNDFIFDYCTFNRDSTLVGSGGIQLRGGCEQTSLTIDHSVFSNNTGSFGGGFAMGSDGVASAIQIDIRNTHFIGNSTRNADGGAIFMSLLRDTTTINIENVVFENNSASEHGGAISIINENEATTFLVVNQSEFIDNVSGSPGGGAINILTLPTFISTSFFKGKITNSLFTGNTGLWNMGPGEEGRVELEMLNCTSYDNGRFILSKTWGAEFDTTYRTAIARIENSIFWEPNLDLQHIFYNGNADSFHVKGYTLRNNLISTTSCDLEACDLADLGGNIYGVNPLFIDEAAGDLHLRACSPAINRGYNTSVVMASSMADLDGNIRIQEDTVDMGAYETLSFSLDAIGNITHSSGATELDGAIGVDNISGGMPPYQFEWSTGDTTASIEGLSTGFYELTITDDQDCQQVFSYFVDVMVNAVEQLDREEFSLFPNPLQQGEILRLFSNKEIAIIEIWDSLGELIWAGSYDEFLNLDYGKYALGLNIIRVWFRDGSWGRYPFLVVD